MYCRWYEKKMEDLAEHEQERCYQDGQECFECPCLIYEEEEEVNI